MRDRISNDVSHWPGAILESALLNGFHFIIWFQILPKQIYPFVYIRFLCTMVDKPQSGSK